MKFHLSTKNTVSQTTERFENACKFGHVFVGFMILEQFFEDFLGFLVKILEF